MSIGKMFKKHSKVLAFVLMLAMIFAILPAAQAFAVDESLLTKITVETADKNYEAVKQADGKYLLEVENSVASGKIVPTFNKENVKYTINDAEAKDKYDFAEGANNFKIKATLDTKEETAEVIVTRKAAATKEIKVNFLLKGDVENPVEGKVYTYKENANEFKTLAEKKEFVVAENTTVKEVFTKILNDEKIAFAGDTYITEVAGLKAEAKGKNSGWLFQVNEKYPEVGFADYKLKDGDNIVFHYTYDFTKENIIEKKFTDVAEDHWAKDYIYELVAKDIVKGKTETTFEPNSNITRAELLTILAEASGEDTTKSPANGFKDVVKDGWYEDSINWGVAAKITNGTTETTFEPNAKITREEIATMIVRYADYKKLVLPEDKSLKTFADDKDIAEYAKNNVYKMQRSGIIEGKEDNKFAPKDAATRAEAAKMIALFLNKTDK